MAFYILFFTLSCQSGNATGEVSTHCERDFFPYFSTACGARVEVPVRVLILPLFFSGSFCSLWCTSQRPVCEYPDNSTRQYLSLTTPLVLTPLPSANWCLRQVTTVRTATLTPRVLTSTRRSLLLIRILHVRQPKMS